jgi:hypothetical protein
MLQIVTGICGPLYPKVDNKMSGVHGCASLIITTLVDQIDHKDIIYPTVDVIMCSASIKIYIVTALLDQWLIFPKL